MQKIVPNIWCSGNAEEAGKFYAEAFADASTEVEARYPTEGLADFQREFAGEALTVGVNISGTRLTLINAGDDFTPNPSISFLLNFDPELFDGSLDAARAELERLWEILIVGGAVLMPLDEYPFSARYGWVQDRFGVSWQLMLGSEEGPKRPFLYPCLMFCGAAQNKALEMVDHYLSVFSDSHKGPVFNYPGVAGPATPASVMYCDFELGGSWIAAMDSGVTQDYSFTPGMSLQVMCEDQQEIDRLWDALSASAENEQCGWLVDTAGVSWQIIPANMEELMAKPGAFERMMGMKKLVIADF